MIAVTFDVDDVAWTDGAPVDEVRDHVPVVRAVLDEHPRLACTWFVRLDAGIRARHGQDDALFVRHAPLLEALRAAGHEVAWHHHAVRPGTTDTPASDPAFVCAELRRLAPRARALGLTSVRLGWAHADTRIIGCLDALGFAVDSTALPRPAYPWDPVVRDWADAPRRPYHPARADHRREGAPACRLLEVPVSVAPIAAPGDTRPDVLRYLNLAYRPGPFARALRALADAPVLVTVTHPYEVAPRAGPAHPLLAHDPAALRANLAALAALARPFVTLQRLGAHHAVPARHHAA